MTNTNASDYSRLRPLGDRILVRRLIAPERTAGGLYLLGRTAPSIGHWLQPGDSHSRWLVQWADDANADLRKISTDLLVIPRNAINLLCLDGCVFASGDRLVVEPLADVEHETSLVVMRESLRSQWQQARIISAGPRVTNELAPDDIVIFHVSKISTIRLSGKTYYVLRSDDCELKMEAKCSR